MKKVILITGSSTGFGALMVNTFSQAGHTVIASMRNVNGTNAEKAKMMSELPNTEVIDLDVTDDHSVQNAVQSVLAKHGKIDVLINNAGIYGGGVLEGYSIPQIQKLFNVNVWGVLRMNNEVLPSMRAAKDGLIITISSQVGRISLPLQAAYNSTKFALEGLIEGAYPELMSQGVESVMIEPGGFMTEIINKTHSNADRKDVLSTYGPEITSMQQKAQEVFGKIFAVSPPDPQLIADAALKLVNTQKGKRPLRTPMDPSSKGIDVEYNNITEEIKKRWIDAYNM